MSKTIVIHCDNHPDGEDVIGVPYPFPAFAGNAPAVLDLCEPCFKERVLPLVELIADKGQPITNGSGGPFICPEPNCGRIFDKKHALGRHHSSAHGKPVPK